MDVVLPLLGAFIVGVFTLFFARKNGPKQAPEQAPPENTAAKAANEAVQQTFEEEISKIVKASKSDDAASTLADLGNARKR